jgi:hypothetical protein
MLVDVYIHVDVCMHVSVCNGWIDGRISLERPSIVSSRLWRCSAGREERDLERIYSYLLSLALALIHNKLNQFLFGDVFYLIWR